MPEPYFSDPDVTVYLGHCLDVLAALPEQSVQCVVTSPPYYQLRLYETPPQMWPDGWVGELGQEPTLALYLDHLLAVFDAVWRVLKDDGILFVNIGDSYCSGGNGTRDPEKWPKQSRNNNGERLIHGKIRPGSGIKPKDLMLVPFRFAIAMQEAGWYVRNDNIWAKPACMPESVTDRATRSHEYVFHFSKKSTYFYDAVAVAEPVAGIPRVPGVVQRADLLDQRIVLGHHFGTEVTSAESPFLSPPVDAHDGCRSVKERVGLAASVLDSTQSKQQLRLGAFDSEVGEQCPRDGDSVAVGGPPKEHRSAVLATRLLDPDVSPKGFPQEINGLSVALPDSDVLRVTRGVSLDADSPSIDGDRDAAIGVDDTSEVGEDQGVIHSDKYTPEGTTSQKTRNMRTVWTIGPEPLRDEHYAAYPSEIPRRCILAGTRQGDTVLDPFGGSGRTAVVARHLGRRCTLIELQPEYAKMIRRQLSQQALPLIA